MPDVQKLEQIVESARSGVELWEELKSRWSELRLPGSQYSPGDFLACLLLSQAAGTAEEIAARVQVGLERLAELKKDRELSYRLLGSDSIPIMLLGFLTPPGAAEAGPLPELAHDVDYQGALARVATEIGITPEELQKRCSERADALEVTPYCLSLQELNALPELPRGRQEHVDHCQFCQQLLRAVVPPSLQESETAPESLTAAPESAPPCPHIGSDGKCPQCTADRVVECSGCGEEVIAGVAVQCKNYAECEHLYCPDCAKKELSVHGYCDDCARIDCSEKSCRENMDRGTEHRCANPRCEENTCYCEVSAKRLLNAAGFCPSCSEEEVRYCNGCEEDFTESRLTRCKEEDCEMDFCNECKDDRLSAAGYCDDHNSITCDGCEEEEIDRGTEHRCSNPDCKQNEDFCDDCAKRILNAKGLCPACSEEEEVDCSDCGTTYTESRLVRCRGRDCENAYCPECKGNNLNNRRLCADCRPE